MNFLAAPIGFLALKGRESAALKESVFHMKMLMKRLKLDLSKLLASRMKRGRGALII